MSHPLRISAVALGLLACLAAFVQCGPNGELPQESGLPGTVIDPQGQGAPPGPLPGGAGREVVAGDRRVVSQGPDLGVQEADGGPLAEGEVARISGRLQLADGTSLGGYRVQLLRVEEGGPSGAAWAQSGQDGSFVFSGLPAGGRYRVRLWAKYRAPSSHEPSSVLAPFEGLVVNVDAVLVRGSWSTAIDAPDAGEGVEVSVHSYGCEEPPFSSMVELEPAGEGGVIERLLPSGCGYVVSARWGDGDPAAFRVPMGSGPGLFVGLLEPHGAGLGAARLVVDGVMPTKTRLDVRIDADASHFDFPVPRLAVVAHVPPGASERRVAGLLPGQYTVTVSTGGAPPFGYVIPTLSSSSVTISPGRVSDIQVQLLPAGLIEVIVEPSAPSPESSPSFLVECRHSGESEWSPLYMVDPSGGPPRGNIAPNKAHVTMDTLRAGPLWLRAQSSSWTSTEVSVEVLAGETVRTPISVAPND